MPKTLALTTIAAALNAGGILISTGQAAEMTWRPQSTDTDTMSHTAPDSELPRQARTRTDRETRIVLALAEARKARHHRDCHCRRFDRQWCNAVDALFSRAANRELEQMTLATNQQTTENVSGD